MSRHLAAQPAGLHLRCVQHMRELVRRVVLSTARCGLLGRQPRPRPQPAQAEHAMSGFSHADSSRVGHALERRSLQRRGLARVGAFKRTKLRVESNQLGGLVP